MGSHGKPIHSPLSSWDFIAVRETDADRSLDTRYAYADRLTAIAPYLATPTARTAGSVSLTVAGGWSTKHLAARLLRL